ncbi:MAG TPA: MASE4 domain-containing protein [Bradyrhizobium sp.]|uniref:MASE4 domain-containing protein n=1 Tax=Bradyrhizobium sp. TaxID=376 RepID=UPI002D7EBF44|nr:MASE4 domain-containing protein [Bradyrhizobium sp.]HET7888558.1 MASE4 domain-containing protein [Bradyrhizobium sp.]
MLSTALATSRQKRAALALAIASLLAFIAVAPFATIPLLELPAFIPAYEAVLFFIDLVTALLLFDQFARVQTRGLLFLAAAYLFDTLIIIPHALSFPGLFWPTGLLGAKDQTTAWLYVFWHGGFAILVLCYSLASRQEIAAAMKPWTRLQVGWAIAGSMLAMGALTVLLTLFATWGHDLLPVVMEGSNYSLLVKKGVSPAVWALTLAGLVLLWRREQRVMDLWLMLVMWIWLFDIALSAVIGSNRFDIGFYAGRLFGLLASSLLLLSLVRETVQLHSRALVAAASLEHKLAQFMRAQAMNETSTTWKSDESPEMFVHRQNIARYRSLLKSEALADEQRHTIETLLRDEERRARD